jgi:hypothetical protein
MRIAILGAGVSAALMAASSVSAAEVQLKHIVAKVVVVPENRSDVTVTILKTNPKLPVRVRPSDDGVTVVDGGSDDWWPRLFGGHISHCRVGPDGASVHVAGVGDFSESELPQILVRTPMIAKVSSSGAVIGSIPSAESLDLSVAGCDAWTVGDIKGRLRLDEAGQGLLHGHHQGHLPRLQGFHRRLRRSLLQFRRRTHRGLDRRQRQCPGQWRPRHPAQGLDRRGGGAEL